tara:strand:- start:5402 stop:5746 length:345 start_codon:yes stop_codon:yes gene_type:complete
MPKIKTPDPKGGPATTLMVSEESYTDPEALDRFYELFEKVRELMPGATLEGAEGLSPRSKGKKKPKKKPKKKEQRPREEYAGRDSDGELTAEGATSLTELLDWEKEFPSKPTEV